LVSVQSSNSRSIWYLIKKNEDETMDENIGRDAGGGSVGQASQ
jgi:hypothetical protein